MCVCKSIKTTELVQASTVACSSSVMLEQYGSTRSTRSSRLARQSRTCRVVSSRVETSQVELGLSDEWVCLSRAGVLSLVTHTIAGFFSSTAEIVVSTMWPVLASIAARRQLRSPQASISWYRQPVAHQLETVRLPFQVQERGTVYTASPPLNLQIVLFLQKRT